MTESNDHINEPRYRPRYLFLSHPRTGSVLLMRMLSHQPRLTQGEYFMTSKMDMMLEEDSETTSRETRRQRYIPKFQAAFDEWQEYATAFDDGEDRFKDLYTFRAEPLASNGDILLFKEHIIMLWDPSIPTDQSSNILDAPPWTLRLRGHHIPPTLKTNPTMFPDEFLESWKPLMMIRHPALTFPSLYRASKGAFGISVDHPWVVQVNSYRMDRTVYDWYREKLGTDASRSGGCDWPVVLDMNDLVNNACVMDKFCHVLGLDGMCLRHEWKSAPEEYLDKQKAHLKYFLSSIQTSEGVLKEKAPPKVCVENEYANWVEEWNVHDADILKRQVENSLDDYEYLWKRRLAA